MNMLIVMLLVMVKVGVADDGDELGWWRCAMVVKFVFCSLQRCSRSSDFRSCQPLRDQPHTCLFAQVVSSAVRPCLSTCAPLSSRGSPSLRYKARIALAIATCAHVEVTTQVAIPHLPLQVMTTDGIMRGDSNYGDTTDEGYAGL